jgi:hypothetical protein
MFSTATGDAAWVEAIKTDWFDEAFQDWGAEALPRTGIHRADLPAAMRTIYDPATLPPNTVPLIYRIDLHGRRGFEMDGGSPAVRLFEATRGRSRRWGGIELTSNRRSARASFEPGELAAHRSSC